MRVAVLSVVAAVVGIAEARVGGMTVAKGGVLRLDGTSTLHPYSAVAKEYHAVFGLSPSAAGDDLWTRVASHRIASFELSIPVKSLTSGESGLDDNLRKALHADRNPTIEFRMTSYAVIPPATQGAAAALKLKGTLEVAGVTRDTEIDVDVNSIAGGLRITGSKVLSMADFKVEAPVLMLGMLRTGDKVTIHLDLQLYPDSPPQGT